MSELADCMDEYPQETANLTVKEKQPLEEVPELIATMNEAEETLGKDGRILVRYSGTERKLRVLVEAKNADLAKKQSERIVSAAQRTLGVA